MCRINLSALWIVSDAIARDSCRIALHGFAIARASNAISAGSDAVSSRIIPIDEDEAFEVEEKA